MVRVTAEFNAFDLKLIELTFLRNPEKMIRVIDKALKATAFAIQADASENLTTGSGPHGETGVRRGQTKNALQTRRTGLLEYSIGVPSRVIQGAMLETGTGMHHRVNPMGSQIGMTLPSRSREPIKGKGKGGFMIFPLNTQKGSKTPRDQPLPGQITFFMKKRQGRLTHISLEEANQRKQAVMVVTNMIQGYRPRYWLSEAVLANRKRFVDTTRLGVRKVLIGF